jgi:hypothetical protein
MQIIRATIIFSSFIFITGQLYSQVFMDADSTGDAYARILAKKYNYEVPDCVHPVRHITEEWNNELRKYIFAFHMHKSIDNDRCLYFDRQRTEIKTDSGSPDSMKATYDETHTYRWKFKLDSAFQPSANFTHIHQIKAGDGTIDTDDPLITLTPVKSSPNKLEIRFYPPYQEIADTTIKLIRVNLAPFLGEWIEAFETSKYDSNYQGSYSLKLRRLSDDSLLLNYSNSGLSMWRRGITFCRPKYGIYRSLLDSNSLRDEIVRFADFYLDEGTSIVLPTAPSNLTATTVTANKVTLTWIDNSNNEGQFRIDRSMDGVTWSYLATARVNVTAYSDTGLAVSTTYYYRVRAENTYGNSSYSNVVVAPQATITATGGANGSIIPTGAVQVNYGANQHFSIVPAANYHVDSLIIDAVKVTSDTQYTFTGITTNHSIRVTFALNSYTITSSAGANGSIFPTPNVSVMLGANQHFSIAPEAHYHVDSLLIDGGQVTSDTQYTFINVIAPHTIRATFAVNTYTITSSAGPNGAITPTPSITVIYGGSQQFNIIPDLHSHVDSLIVDGTPVVVDTQYTFNDVQASHTIRVVFGVDGFTITATSGSNGTITPSGGVNVNFGSEQRFTFSPLAGYNVDTVYVDGVATDSANGYTFFNVTADHTIHATFFGYGISSPLHLAVGWNMLSLPLYMIDCGTSSIFPDAISSAYSYEGLYAAMDTLDVGLGFWIKYPTDTTIELTGVSINSDTVEVHEGWNMIGSLTIPIFTASIISDPPTILTSQFFTYGGRYFATDTLKPGLGYWVKVNHDGKLILSVNPLQELLERSAIRIEISNDRPPSAPDAAAGLLLSTPKDYSLEQNYPNPFNPTTVITYSLPTDAQVQVTIFNLLGEQIETLVDGTQTAGQKSAAWNAQNYASGLYYFRLLATSIADPTKYFSQTRNMMLLK